MAMTGKARKKAKKSAMRTLGPRKTTIIAPNLMSPPPMLSFLKIEFPNNPTFKGDRDRLQQVLSNLVENGIKYSMPGGLLSVHAELQDSIIKCWVNDTGVGIPASDLQIIFERFNQLDNFPDSGSRGYGLGLSIAKEIVKSNGGQIWVESKLKVGSTFFFTIPV